MLQFSAPRAQVLAIPSAAAWSPAASGSSYTGSSHLLPLAIRFSTTCFSYTPRFLVTRVGVPCYTVKEQAKNQGCQAYGSWTHMIQPTNLRPGVWSQSGVPAGPCATRAARDPGASMGCALHAEPHKTGPVHWLQVRSR